VNGAVGAVLAIAGAASVLGATPSADPGVVEIG